MIEHECTNRKTIKHPDGTLHQVCGECGTDAGQVMRSGSEWSAGCREGATILPTHPVFWDEDKGREWFQEYVARQEAAGGYISPEVLAKAA